jgi:hypothetical protein
MWKGFPLISGRWARPEALLLLIVLTAGCNYGLRGGGGFPAHVRTIYIEPFDNRTAQFDLDQQIFSAVVARVPSGLGIRPGGRDAADAVLRGTITRYDDVVDALRTARGGEVTGALQHQVQIGISVRIIDIRNNVILWEAQSLLGQGAYTPGAQTDQEGRARAIEQLVQKIIDGAQSQW